MAFVIRIGEITNAAPRKWSVSAIRTWIRAEMRGLFGKSLHGVRICARGAHSAIWGPFGPRRVWAPRWGIRTFPADFHRESTHFDPYSGSGSRAALFARFPSGNFADPHGESARPKSTIGVNSCAPNPPAPRRFPTDGNSLRRNSAISWIWSGRPRHVNRRNSR